MLNNGPITLFDSVLHPLIMQEGVSCDGLTDCSVSRSLQDLNPKAAIMRQKTDYDGIRIRFVPAFRRSQSCGTPASHEATLRAFRNTDRIHNFRHSSPAASVFDDVSVHGQSRRSD